MELIDTSAWARRATSASVAEEIERLVRTAQAATCHPVMLELLYSARNGNQFAALRAGLEELALLAVGPREWLRALEVYEALARQGGAHQRSVKHMDLLVAASAESAGARVVHYDEDFERVAAITGQPVRWVAERGSL